MQTHAGNGRRQHSGILGYAIPMVTSNCATMTIFVPCDLDLWPFDLWVNACRATTVEYTCTKCGVDSLSRFPVRSRTNRQTNATERSAHAGSYAVVGNDIDCESSIAIKPLVEGASLLTWVGGPLDASFGFYLREAFQSQTNREKIIYKSC